MHARSKAATAPPAILAVSSITRDLAAVLLEKKKMKDEISDMQAMTSFLNEHLHKYEPSRSL
jgi:hypothetical protein